MRTKIATAVLLPTLLTLAGCGSDLTLRTRTRWAAVTAPTCPAPVASTWCTERAAAGRVYYAGPPFQYGGEQGDNPLCRCPR